MSNRDLELHNKVAVVFGAGQSPGIGVGNGRATVQRFTQEGASVLGVDINEALAKETANVTTDDPGECIAFKADVAVEEDIQAAIQFAIDRWKRIDILHYNVGISVAGNDASPTEITADAFDRITTVNLRGAVLAAKHVLPIMREERSGVILTIASISAYQRYPWVTYKTSKAGLIAFTQQIAIDNAEYGIRANTILPGLMDTPMAVDTRARAFNRPRDEVAAERDAKVPLGARMGTGWDVANAAVFLASEKAKFITGVELPVDGGALLNIAR